MLLDGTEDPECIAALTRAREEWLQRRKERQSKDPGITHFLTVDPVHAAALQRLREGAGRQDAGVPGTRLPNGAGPIPARGPDTPGNGTHASRLLTHLANKPVSLAPARVAAAGGRTEWQELEPGSDVYVEETENEAGDLALWMTTTRRDLPECRARITLGEWSGELHLARATPEAADLCGGVTIPAAVRRSAPERTRLEVEATEAPPAGE